MSHSNHLRQSVADETHRMVGMRQVQQGQPPSNTATSMDVCMTSCCTSYARSTPGAMWQLQPPARRPMPSCKQRVPFSRNHCSVSQNPFDNHPMPDGTSNDRSHASGSSLL